MIDDKVNLVVGEVFKIFGPLVIQGILGGNKNAGNKTETGTTVHVQNPFNEEDKEGDDGEGFKSFVDDDDFFAKPKDNEIGSKIQLDNEKESRNSAVSSSANAIVTPKTTINTFIDETTTTTTATTATTTTSEENGTQGPAQD
jgi:hypothetical protein